jgi:hypothetical protein
MNSNSQQSKPKPKQVAIVVVKRCHTCGHRLFDKLTACTGTVAIKCSKCGTICQLNMACRLAV